ncbi:unnamed protein product, partial [Durusdinium trenchii]
ANFRALTALEGERPTQPQKRQRPSKYIVPKVENFKRSKAASRLVRQEVLKLVDEQARLCPGKVMRTIDGKNVRYSSSGRVESIALDVLLEKVHRALKDGSTREMNTMISQIARCDDLANKG